MNAEDWAVVQDYEELYEVSTEGNVRSIKTGHILKPVNKDANLYVTLTKNGVPASKAICRLVAVAFIPNPDNYPIAYHISDDLFNNGINNIAWGTQKDVCQAHSELYNAGGMCVSSFTLDGLYNGTWTSAVQASEASGVSESCIRRVLNRIRKTAGNLQWAYTKSMIKPTTRLFKCRCCGMLKPPDGFASIPVIKKVGKYSTYRDDPVCTECIDYLTNDDINDLV